MVGTFYRTIIRITGPEQVTVPWSEALCLYIISGTHLLHESSWKLGHATLGSVRLAMEGFVEAG